MKTRTVLILIFTFVLFFLAYDVRSLIVHGFDLNKHVPFLMPGVLLFFAWCTFKVDQVTCPRPVELAKDDLPQGVTPIGRYLKEAAEMEAEEKPVHIPDGHVLTKDGKYVVPEKVRGRVDAPDGLGG